MPASIWKSQAYKPVAAGAAMFRKSVVQPTQKLFRKGGAAEQFVDAAHSNLRKTGNTLADINREAGKVLNSQAAQNLANRNEKAQEILTALKGTNDAVGLSGNLANQGAQFANRKNYSGSSGDVATNMLERATKIGETGAEGHKIKFT